MEPKKDFEDLISMGCITKTFKVGEHEIVMKTLDTETQGQIMGQIPTDGPESKKVDVIQRLMLANAIVAIDGEQLPLEKKMALLGKGQAPLTIMLFGEYENMLNEQGAIFDSVKKNILQIKKTP